MSSMLPIKAVEPGSAAARAGLRAGERLRSMGGAPVRDIIDLRFEGAEPEIVAEVVSADGALRTVVIERRPGEALGIETVEMRPRTCANKCVFCFIDQMPPGRRRGLYVRDEDFRFSFLHGNYVTLTNARPRDIERIIDQGLSPLYVSVHATDPAVRARLLGIPVERGAEVLPVLRQLAEGGIRIHAQVVLCPGWNDGPVLAETITALGALYPAVRSVAVVPLGLTAHRRGLEALAPVTPEIAVAVMRQVQELDAPFVRQNQTPFVYLADEWYFLTGAPIPDTEYYADFPLLEDGVGMTRSFIDQASTLDDSWPLADEFRGRRVTVVTSVMPAQVVQSTLVDGALARCGARAALVAVHNRFLGPGITVSGLLAGSDILTALGGQTRGDCVMLPPNCVNGRGLFLDDMELAELKRQLGVPVFLGLGDTTRRTNPVWEKD